MRLFVALELPATIKTALAAAQTELRRAQAQVSWTKPENLHLTLKFLGEVEEVRLAALAQACVETANVKHSFNLALSGLGVFPNARHPRVVWAGLQGDLAELQALQQSLADKLAGLGFAPEEKPFQPHLTLGRIKMAKNVQQLVSRIEAYQLPALAFSVAELVLIQSQLHAAGSIYTSLQRARLSASSSPSA